MKKTIILFLLGCLLSSSAMVSDDLFVKIYKDDLRENNKVYLNIFKKPAKDVSAKFSIQEYQLVILNQFGKAKWKGTFDTTEVDFKENNINVKPGDQIVIRDITLIEKKSGKTIVIERITERYLIR
jgi:hypothetical protein